VYGAFHSHIFPTPLRFVRTRTHKLVYNRCDRGELYNLIDDPWELQNLMNAPGMAATQRQLMERLREHMIRLEDPIQGAFDRIRHVY
jgi:hypothetical protein